MNRVRSSSRIGKIAYGLAIGWAVAAPAILWATAPAAHHRTSDPKIISICVTARSGSIQVGIGGGPSEGGTTPAVQTTCTGI